MDRYAVVGNPIAHSKSPEIHRLFAEQTQQLLSYEKMLIEQGQFAADVQSFFAHGGKGLNVTVPFKEEACQYADLLTERATLAGAVNTLTLQSDGKILGDTTDGAGLVSDLNRLGWSLEQSRILVLGAGGAVRGVIQPLLQSGIRQITIANRTVSKAHDLAEIFAKIGDIGGSSFEALGGEEFDIIINGTAASLSGEIPPISETILTKNSKIYDMMYGAQPTAFMKWAQQNGVNQVSDGLGMLVGQAAESFYIWRNVKPDIDTVISELRASL